MKGYYVAGPATLIGSGLAFIVLRFLFKEQVMAWSSKNEKWQALEQVIVRLIFRIFIQYLQMLWSGSEWARTNDPYSTIIISALCILAGTFCSRCSKLVIHHR
jgi:hypothetical protein